VKFNTRDDGRHAGALEYAYSEIARAAGAEISLCRLIETKTGRFFATRRFDRGAGGRRIHTHSAAGLLHADFRIAGNEYADLFKLADALTRDYRAKRELFRRACLNVLLQNRDDHLKNFAFLMDASGAWTLSPFYDFTFNQGPRGWHTLSVAGEGEHPGNADLLRLAKGVSLEEKHAKEILAQTQDAQSGLATRAKNLGIPKSFIPR
jgi:serine/threonine-protein kinase HipA